ncbi:MAG: hypothetical protein ACLFS9_08190 [Nitriliruptoraceae bacterium]
MSVRVNLLPGSFREGARADRQRWALVGVAAVVLVVLGVLTLLQQGAISDAEEELAAAQVVETELRGERAELEAYADLESQVLEAQRLVSTALGAQASMAGVLQDIAIVLPSDTALTSLSVDVSEAGSPEPGPEAPVHGSVTMSAESLSGHAPGVEQVLRGLDQIAAFRSVYVTSSTLDPSGEELGVDDLVVFNLDLQLGPEVLTRRYTDGVPGELP